MAQTNSVTTYLPTGRFKWFPIPAKPEDFIAEMLGKQVPKWELRYEILGDDDSRQWHPVEQATDAEIAMVNEARGGE